MVRYISVDVETSGPLHGFHNLLEIGAVNCDNFSEKFQTYIIPLTLNWTDSARSVNKPEEFYNIDNALRLDLAMIKFAKWLEGERPIFVGFNTVFDYGWINYEFLRSSVGKNPFGINGIDIKAYAMGKLNCEWRETSKKGLKEKRIISRFLHTHNALEDALEQADLFNQLRKII